MTTSSLSVTPSSMRPRYRPALDQVRARLAGGAAITIASSYAAVAMRDRGPAWAIGDAIVPLLCWLTAVDLTDRYRHKYPYRYYTYLLASHAKGLAVMLLVAGAVWVVGFVAASDLPTVGLALGITVAADLALSLPRLSVSLPTPAAKDHADHAPANREDTEAAIEPVDTRAILAHLATQDLPQTTAEMLRQHLPTTVGGIDTYAVVDDLSVPGRDPVRAALGLLVGRRSLNHVQRLNNYLREATHRIAKGGYIAAEYLPMEAVLAGMRERYPRLLYVVAYANYFIRYRALPKIPALDRLYFHPMLAWFDRFLQLAGHGRNRSLSRAEVWGRLAYYGFEVIHESSGPGPRVVLAQRMTEPVANRKPSFYAIVALEKVGLDGEVIRLHKVRSMYPFSEFLQKKIFQSHGLSNTGKFRNDFRLTDYGPMIRRSWIDEIPGLIDWLRGDIKLVGMRATSPHYLSLYPKDVYNLYVQVKPGLIPPIFDEKTTGFDQIVSIERTYLTRYLTAPIRTDIQYFWYTFRDIFLRRVRSS